MTLLLLLVIGVAAGGFGLLQTPIGLAWLGRTAAGWFSGPGFVVTIHGLHGLAPFHLRADQITGADERGVWVTVRDAGLELSPSGLLAGKAHILSLTAAEIEAARPPETTRPAGTPPAPLSEELHPPQPPAWLSIDRLAVGRLVLDEPVLGSRLEAALTGAVARVGDADRVSFDLHRTDGVPGSMELELGLKGSPASMTLRLTASEPTGLLLDNLLHRDDHRPLAMSLMGEGAVSDWRGRLELSAGADAGFTAQLSLAGGEDAKVAMTGEAAVAPLLTRDLAPLVGERVPVSVALTFKPTGAVMLDAMAIGLAAGNLTVDAALGAGDGRVAAHVKASFPNLAAASGIAGGPVQGSAKVEATVSGTEQKPVLQIDAAGDNLYLGGSGAEHAVAHLTVAAEGNPLDPAAPVHIVANGEIRSVRPPDTVALPPGLGRDFGWSLAASAARDGSVVELTRLAASGAGLDLRGSGRWRSQANELNGRLQLDIADLRPFAAAFGYPAEGTLSLQATAAQHGAGPMKAEIEGAVSGLRTGIPAVDALADGSVTLTAAAESRGGGFVLDRLAVAGRGFSVNGSGRLDLQTRQLSATIDASVPRLQPIGPALGMKLAGEVTARTDIEGSLDRPLLHADISGTELIAGDSRLDRLNLVADMADLLQPRLTLSGTFSGGGIDGTLGAEAAATDTMEVLVPRLHLQGAGAMIDGSLRLGRDSRLVRGAVSGTIPDLSRWSRLIGMPLAGSFDFRAGLDARGGQSLDLTARGERLAAGAGASRLALSRLAVNARLNDLFGAPAGKAQATATGASFPAGTLTEATLTIDGTRAGRFAFAAGAKGNISEPVAIGLGGDCSLALGAAGLEIRLTRLSGTIGGDPVLLRQPLTVAKHGNDLVLSGLALSLGRGHIEGNAALRERSVSLRLTARDLPIAAVARPAGYKDASGTINLDASLSGTNAVPQGRFTLSGRALRVVLPKQPHLPTLALDASGNWNGRKIDLKGRVAGPKGETLDFSGSAPLVYTAAPFGITLPSQGSIAARLQGAGELGNLADLLPLGEDRLTGRFALDVSASGTLASPAVAGHLTIANGRYESLATGAVLTDLRADLAGDRDRFTLRELAAGDAAGGRLTARGSLLLRGGAPTADFSATLANFRVAARDEAVVKASGAMAVAGPVAAPKVSGELTITSGEFTIPDGLPPSVTRLNVVEIGHGVTPPPALPAPASPALAAALDVTVAVPERVFVRGHGLDSEWRGRLKVTGTSAAPQIVGALQCSRGSFSLLGKSFRVARGKIAFEGGAKIDPALDILAELNAADITAQVAVGGVASAPTITLSSTPALPQDEILARVLFNNAVGQITPAEGIEVAQAAATLAGGGPGVLDRLRSSVGLDRLSFGAAPAGAASSNLNPAAGGSAASGTAVSGGKYVAKGVYVGASQGTTAQSSTVTVEIEVRRHLTVETDVNQTTGNGIGLNYKLDY
ncbi:MAG TPA: translocation/assembly module TamB domain-containing protein [Stellaceae bacterium]|nr:translocation/assembly module TamB domain-containing protein [Stellaceae bacterium]